MPETHRNRLDGWKTIAKYLGKDTTTATRWARERGMPVHRVPGGKRATIYAYTDELDVWLRGLADEPPVQNEAERTPSGSNAPQDATDTAEQGTLGRRRITLSRRALLGAGLALLIALIGIAILAARRPGLAKHVSISGSKLLAYDEKGRLTWEYEFPQTVEKPAFESAQSVRLVDMDSDNRQEILLAVAFPNEGAGDIAREALYCFSDSGKVVWRYDPQLTLSFAGRRYEGPWHITDLLLCDNSSKSIWLAMTHYTWWPSFIAKLDLAGKPSVQFVNAGGMYRLGYLRTDEGSFILACGVNNEHSAGMLVALNESQTPSASPQSLDSAYQCDSCPEGKPFRYFLFPRSELNVHQGIPYNPVKSMRVFENRIEIGSHEVEPNAQLLYELSKSLDVEIVSMSDGYAEMHRQLWRENKIGHPLDDCPALMNPYTVRVWDERTGWVQTGVPWAVGQGK